MNNKKKIYINELGNHRLFWRHQIVRHSPLRETCRLRIGQLPIALGPRHGQESQNAQPRP